MVRSNLTTSALFAMVILSGAFQPGMKLLSFADEAGQCAASRAREIYLSGYLPVEGPKPVVEMRFRGKGPSTYSIADWRGRAVVLNFWATWCPPCVKELPALNQLKVALKDTGVHVVAINEDKDSAEDVAAFLASVGATGLEPFWDPGRSFMKAAQIASLPTTLLIDRQGHEVAAVLKEADWDDPAVVKFIIGCLEGNRRFHQAE